MGLAAENLGDGVFNHPDPPALAGPPMCTYHPTFVTRSAAGLHALPVCGGEVVLRRGPYQLEHTKDGRTDGDALLHWGITCNVRPERYAGV